MGEYADLLDGAGDKQRASLNLRFGVEANPDLAARNGQLAKRYGLPVGVIDEFKPDYEARAKTEDAMAQLEQSPKLRAWLAADANNAKLSHDDLGSLSGLETAFKPLASAAKWFTGAPGASSTLGGDLQAAYHAAGSGAAGAFGAVSRTLGTPLAFLEDYESIGGNPLFRLSEGFMMIADRNAAASKAAAGKSDTWLGGAVSSGVQSLAQNAPGMAMALLPGGQAAALASMGITTGGQTYQKDMEKGRGHWTALSHGASDAAIEIGTEMGPLGGLVDNIKAGTPLMTTLLKNAWAENKGEQVATLLQDLNDWAVNGVNEGQTFMDYLKARPEAAAQTAIATLIGSAGNVALLHSVQTMADNATGTQRIAQQAEVHAQVLEQVVKTAEASKLLERSPENLTAYMQGLADDGAPNIYLDSAKLVEAGVDMQALAQALPSVAAQLDQVETGGDLVVPTGELLTGTIGAQFGQALIDNARTEVNGMSREEAKVYMQEHGDQLQAEVTRVLAEKANDEEFRAGRDLVQADLLQQLNKANRFTPKVNEQYATLAANFYAVMAARTGMTVQQFADTYKLGVKANEVAGGMYDQGGKLATESPEFKTWFGDSNVVDAEGKPLAVYHGTNKDFASFKPSKSGLTGAGAYFGLSADVAEGYDGDGKGGQRLMPVYVRGKFLDLMDWSKYVQDHGGWEQARAAAESEGYAGVIDRKYEDAVNVWNPDGNVKSVFNRGTWNPNDANILNQSQIDDPKTGVSAVLLALGQNDALYQYPRSDALDLRDLAFDKTNLAKGENALGIDVSDVDKTTDDNTLWLLANTVPEDNAADGTKSWILKLTTGKYATMTRQGGEVHINVSGVGEGNGGSLVYDLAANYALTNGLEFVGDPLGVSPAAMRRRLENMLSSAVKYGTTDHLRPHPDQLLGDAGIGVPPLNWTKGDTLGNIRSMVDVSIAANEHANPIGSDLVYDAASATFKDGSTGAPVGTAKLAGMVAEDRGLPGTGKAGVRTLQRNALFKSLVQSEGARRLLLESVRRQQDRGGPGVGGALTGTFYQGVNKAARGQIAFSGDITQQASIISLLQGADLSTFIHESGHFFLEVQADLASRIARRIAQGEQVSAGERSILEDMNKTLAWMGVKGDAIPLALDESDIHLGEQLADLARRVKTTPRELITSWKQKPPRRGEQGALWKALNGIPELALFAAENPGRTTQYSAGITPLDQWHLMGIDQKRPYHEQWARGFEAYAFEGNAPSLDLQRVFQTFRAWLVNVYRALLKSVNANKSDVGGALRVELSDEVRSVMDRMLATSDQIAEAEAARAMGPLFNSAEQAGMTLDEYKAYHDQGIQATTDAVDALQARGLRDMQWLQNARSRKLKELQAQHDDTRRLIEREVRAEVMSQPIYQAWAFLTSKADTQATPGVTDLATTDLSQASGKLRTQVLRDMYGTRDDAIWRKLSELHMTSDTVGLHPDLVAERFGFSSGDELVKKLADAEPPKSVIEGMTDTRMLQEHGDLASPAGLERAADAATHNDARAKFVATELKALQKAMSTREKVPGQKNTVDVLARAAREYAAQIIARQRVRDIRPKQYAAAEVRAAKAAAAAVGDIAKATLHKRNQLINLYAAKAAYAAQDEVRAAVDYFKRFDNPSKTLDPEYRQQIEALLERFDLRASTTLKALDRRASLVEWVKAQEDQGLSPDIPPELLQEANRKSFKDMTVEEVRGLRDTIKQIEHLGRLKNRLLTAQANRDFQAVVGEIVDSIDENAKGRHADTRTPNTVLGEKLLGLKNFWASHIKVATWARIMDGGKDGGPVWEYLVRTANHAGDTEVVMREKATKELAKLVAPVLKEGRMGGKGEYFASINRTLNKEARLAIALNTGNASNLQRLLGGEGWTPAQLQPVLDTLSAADWQFVQAVWDHFESYRPAIGEKEKRVYGREPQWIEPTSVQTPYGVLRGGYYPVKFDPRASERAEAHADAEDTKRQLAGAYTSATTRRSFTKARVEEVNGRPLLYSLDGIYNGVQEVIHDLTWHEWLIDANRLVRNQKIAGAMRNKYGPDAHHQFKRWLEDNAAGDRGAQAAGEKALAYIRQGVSISGLGWNIMSAAMQPLGITQSIVRIGPKWVGRGIAKAIGSPIETANEINEKSDFMRTRALTRLREIAEVRSQVKGRTKVREAVDVSAYFLMMRAQQLVDVPTWWGAYEKAISEGNDEARAVALSDQAVIDAQGSGGTKDQSAIERGSPGIKLFTTFYSFFNTALNLGVGQTMTHENKVKLAADYLLLYSVPAVLGALLKDVLTPGDSGDWDEEKLLKRLIGEQLSFLMGLMFGVREVTGAVQAVTGTAQYATDYSGPAGVRLGADLVKLGKQIHQGEFDDGLRKAIINVAGELLRLPAAQVNRTVTGINALNDGKTSNPAAVLTGYQEPHR